MMNEKRTGRRRPRIAKVIPPAATLPVRPRADGPGARRTARRWMAGNDGRDGCGPGHVRLHDPLRVRY